MINLQNIFQQNPKDDKEIQEAEKMLDMTAQKARICLGYSDFKVFKDSYERTERVTVDAMISFTKSYVEGTGDISRYAMVMSRLATKLETLRYLLKTIEAQSKRGQENENAVKQS